MKISYFDEKGKIRMATKVLMMRMKPANTSWKKLKSKIKYPPSAFKKK